MGLQETGKTGIRARLVLLTLGLLIAGILIGAYLLWDSYRNSRAAFDRQLMETARALSLVVDREFGQAATLNRALATSEYLARGDFEGFDRQVRRIGLDSSMWIAITDRSGRQFVNTHVPRGTSLPDMPIYPDIWEELDKKKAAVSNLFHCQLAQRNVVAVSTPLQVAGKDGFAISLVMLPSVQNRILAEQDLPAGWNGNIIDAALNIVSRSTGGDAVVGRQPSQAFIDSVARQDQGIVESVSIEGEKTIVAYNRSPVYRWTFGVSVPRYQVLSDVTRSLSLAALGGIGLLLLAAFISSAVARSISRPVQGLVAAARALGRGEPIIAPKSSIREVNAVSASLQNAAEELSARSRDLQASESRLRLAVQATGIGIWDVDFVTGERIWSPEFYDIIGLPRDEAASLQRFAEIIHPDDREWASQRYEEFCKGEGNGFFEAEFRLCLPGSAERRWVVVSGRMIADADGKPVRASGTMTDITERRVVEESVRESEERFRSLADSAPALIWMTDETGKMIFLNRFHERFFGRRPDELLDMDWSVMLNPGDASQVLSQFQNTVDNRETWRAEIQVRDASGSTRWLRCEGAPRFGGPEKQFLGYVGCNIDITDSKLASDALERRIDDRTHELAAANRQLLAQISEREKVEATLQQVQRLEAVGQLTSGVAHDFNNLLTVILGNLSFVERTATDPQSLRRFSNMRMAAERGASLVSQLLAFSRRQRLEPKAVNLNETVGGMRELLQSSMGGSVAVDIALGEDVWPALVDTTQMELIILNLAINARDAMDVGGLLKVETSNVTLKGAAQRPEEPGPGDYVCVAVSDSGSGIGEEVLNRVFEPFFTTKDVGKGSGLGLSQVLGFAKQSGGGVRIETGEGRGTTVYVFLPRADEEISHEVEARPIHIEKPSSKTAPSVLLVDDDDLVRDVTAMKLTELGYDVTQAANGPSALMALEKDKAFDLLVLDFAMPGMNGAEVARAARKRRPNLPLVFLTGYADLTALGEFASEAILHKPFRDEDLQRQVLALIEGHDMDENASPAEA